MGERLFGSERFGQGLVSTYVERIAQTEPTDRAALEDLSLRRPHNAGRFIGYGCVLLATGNDKRADAVLRRVRDTMRPYAVDPGHNFRPALSGAAHLFHTATLLLERDEADAAQAFQDATHEAAVKQLKAIHKAMPGANGDAADRLRGMRMEFNILGLLTRSAGAGTLAVRALDHHDHSNRHEDSYDVLVVDAGGQNTGPTFSKAQIKNGCLDFENGKEGEPRGRAMRAGYKEDIALVSGHCDVLKGDWNELRLVARGLEAEAKGRATQEVIDMLDQRTLHLLGVIIDPEPWRMGMVPLEAESSISPQMNAAPIPVGL